MSESQLPKGYPLDLPSWQALESHYANDMQSNSIADLFKTNAQRFDDYSLEAGDLFLDYSKNVIDSNTREHLVTLAIEAGVPESINAMFSGEKINNTEDRSVLHVALRSKMSDQLALDMPGVDEIWSTLEEMTKFVNAVQQGQIVGSTGRRLTEIVNIGIGGSDLGPVMAARALRHYWQ
ncbi:MAG: glucose-6-phosphate isomerase, partial [Woeseia sp.]|nr:glucose-6-phosphate isomerase [Woeseia sp.]